MNNQHFDVCWVTVNRSCNLRCSFCYAIDTIENKKVMPIENAKQIVDFCCDAKINKIIIIGGEPTLYSDIFELIKYAREKNIKSSLVTNGVKLESLQYCKDLINAGIDEIGFSLKGNNQEDFKNVTGRDSFNKVVRGMKNLKILNIPFSCSMVITEKNLFSFLKGVEVAFKYGCNGISLSFAYEFNMSKEKDKNYLYKQNPYYFIRAFISQIDKLNEISKNKWSFESGYPLCLFSEEEIEKLGGHLVTTCQLLNKNGIIFDTELNVLPCNTMHAIRLGRLGKDFNSYKEFDNYSKDGLYKQVISYITSLPSQECLECDKLVNCGGGCVCFWSNTSYESLQKEKTLLKKEAEKKINYI